MFDSILKEAYYNGLFESTDPTDVADELSTVNNIEDRLLANVDEEELDRDPLSILDDGDANEIFDDIENDVEADATADLFEDEEELSDSEVDNIMKDELFDSDSFSLHDIIITDDSSSTVGELVDDAESQVNGSSDSDDNDPLAIFDDDELSEAELKAAADEEEDDELDSLFDFDECGEKLPIAKSGDPSISDQGEDEYAKKANAAELLFGDDIDLGSGEVDHKNESLENLLFGKKLSILDELF